MKLLIDCVGVLTTRQPLWVTLSPRERSKEIEEIVEEMKGRTEKRNGNESKKQKK